MENKDFKVIKEEVSLKVYELENIKRREYFVKYKYMDLFKEYLIEQIKIKYENYIIFESIKAYKDNKDINLDDVKMEFESKLNNFINNCNIAKQVLDIYDKYDKTKIKELDDLYMDYVYKYHPAVNVKSNSEQVGIYQALTNIYLVGELDEFKAIYMNNVDKLSELIIEDDESEIIEVYEKTLENINEFIEKRKNSLPLLYENIVYNEQMITKEISTFRESIYDLKVMNENLKKDYKLTFNKEYGEN